jgi:DNA-binding transcriptional MerR regulator
MEGEPMRNDSEPVVPVKKSRSVPYRQDGVLPKLAVPSPLPPEPVGIAEMANLFGVTHRTLHFYEEKGILSSRRAGLMRIYSHRDIKRMALINACREIGIPVATIQDFMDELDQANTQIEADATFRTALTDRKRELTSELSTIRRQIEHVNNLLAPDNEANFTASGTPDEQPVQLTEIERKCLELMAEGYAPVRLARAIGVSGEELHRLELVIIQKFSANNRFQAVAKAVLLGIIPA